MLSQLSIHTRLKAHQKMLAAGDNLPSLSELARRAGCKLSVISEVLKACALATEITDPSALAQKTRRPAALKENTISPYEQFRYMQA